MSSKSIRKLSFDWHKKLSIIAGIALFIWGGSGLFHTFMTRFGPQPVVFYPPMKSLDLAGITPLKTILERAGIDHASAIRIVAGEGDNLLQVTETPDTPRRYFDLKTGDELPDHDKVQAIFLARHYTGSRAKVREVSFLTEFTPSYPSVNRLLPVYKVAFQQDDDLSIYIYTETSASAAVNNTLKNALQTGFRWFHTLSWFPQESELVRVIVVIVLVGSLLATAVSGLAMLITFKRKKRAPGLRGWHRLASFGLGVPILLLTFSGIFHLVSLSGREDARNLTLPAPMSLADIDFPLHEQWADISKGLTISTLSIVRSPDGQTLYRLGLRPDMKNGPKKPEEIRSARFAGVSPTGPALYIDAKTGTPYADGDRELALQMVEQYTGTSRDAIQKATLVTRFGPSYDFRNKRLPVWQFDYGAPINATVFIDTTTGVLADKLPNGQKAERLSFSLLHKWNFLRAFGAKVQNTIVIIILGLSLILMAGFGLFLSLKRPKKR